MLSEVFWIQPWLVVEEIVVPTLIVHGTEDTFVSIEGSRQAALRFRVEHRLVEIDGAGSRNPSVQLLIDRISM